MDGTRFVAPLRAVAAVAGAVVTAGIGFSATNHDPRPLPPPAAGPVDFVRDIQPILQAACLSCHGEEKQRGDYRLDARSVALTGGSGHAPNIIPGRSADSPLIRFVAGQDPEIFMPPKGDRLTADHISLLRRWIDDGAAWPETASVEVLDKADWWSLKPMVKAAAPPLPPGGRNLIDGWVADALSTHNLSLAPEADARTLIRRLTFDLTGLPPNPDAVDDFVRDWATAPDRDRVYGELVDSLLASPQYGERWARHWLDVVHFGETHGYDKDQPRPHAWPYRDYVIRSFNADKPYARFVQEQVAGDVLFPDTVDGQTALGFIAAGPWDLIGHAEVPESKIDGQIARHLDRDNMVANTIGTFNAMTIHCAQCHDHKFDPITTEDYYGLQSVFAALDRADRPYDTDPAIARQRADLLARQRELATRHQATLATAREVAGDALAGIEKSLAEMERTPRHATRGWHSNLEPSPNVTKWVQVDLGEVVDLREIGLRPCHDDFNQIGAGFGFPVRFRLEAANDPEFSRDVMAIADHTEEDFPNPGINALRFPTTASARYLRLTATTLASRKDSFMAAIAELEAVDTAGTQRARGAAVTSLDSIESDGAWSRAFLTDGHFPGAPPASAEDASRTRQQLLDARRLVVKALAGDATADTLDHLESERAHVDAAVAALPPPQRVYAGTIHHGSGAFAGTGATGGQPRPVHVLARGDVRRPIRPATPGAIASISGPPAHFHLPADAPEGERRAALARWLTDPHHPLTWRTIVNRVWQYHFGRGLVDTPNDFGRMGGLPSHPELLDWLAVIFRDDLDGSVKALHRHIVTSATYRQQSNVDNPAAEHLDAANSLLWRQNRRRLEAEAVRDSVLAVAGALDLTMGGPSFQDFVIERPEHSPHYQYHLADPENPALHRRSVYRFLVRSQQQPWMVALDCADPSMMVDKRNQTITPLQALAQLNNQLMVVMARRFAERATTAGPDLTAQITAAFRLAVQRAPEPAELDTLVQYARTHGMANTCRLLINLNEFIFID